MNIHDVLANRIAIGCGNNSSAMQSIYFCSDAAESEGVYIFFLRKVA